MSFTDKVIDIIHAVESEYNGYSYDMDEVVFRTFIKMFNKLPNCWGAKYSTVQSGNPIVSLTTANNIIKYLDDHHIEYYRVMMKNCGYIFAENMCMIYDVDEIDGDITVMYADEFPSFINDCISYTYKTDDIEYTSVGLTIRGDFGFKDTRIRVKKTEFNPINYNDDLNDEHISNVIKSDESGIILLHGLPGTGKTTYIRSLISRFGNEVYFRIIDSSLFSYITDSTFVQMLLKNKNCVFILEDCEELLQTRDGNNSNLSILLNLSDGIVGDACGLKFICTFNTSFTNIDTAITRAGRLKYNYEFSQLSADKADKLLIANGKKPLHQGMTVANIYNDASLINNDSKQKVGF